VDGAFGLAAVVAEMLLQSHQGEIELLPALPASWTEGRVHGLRARGGFEVALSWAAGKMKRATILSTLGGTCRVRAGAPVVVSSGGGRVRTVSAAPGLIEFATAPGRSYILSVR
jgi:alpha-L-fucosidase 2